MIPNPDPVVVRILTDLTADTPIQGRASTVLGDELPAVRVTKVGDAEDPATDWEAAPRYQIEVWATDEIEAGDLAWDLRNRWPTARRQVVGNAVVHGRWVETNPRSFPDTSENIVADGGTDYARHIFTVGVRLSGASV